MCLRHLVLAVLWMFLQKNAQFVQTTELSCEDPLGMESGDIPSNAITCSDSQYPCSNARLNSLSAYVSTSLRGSYIQIDMGSQKHVSAVGTQVETSFHVTAFSLAFTENGLEWFNYLENGKLKLFFTSPLGSNGLNHTMHSLSKKVLARMVRFYVQDSKKEPTLRVELYGCESCVDALGVANGLLPDSSIKASSYLDSGFYPWFGRLDKSFGNGSWCSEANDPLPYLQFYLGPDKEINEIAIQGIPLIKFNKYDFFPCSEQISPSPTTAFPSSTINTTNVTEPIPVYQLDGSYDVVKIYYSNGTHCNATIRVIEPAWVSKFSVLYSDDATEWTGIIEKGMLKKFLGSRKSGLVRNVRITDQPFKAKYIRIVPVAWKNWICMRVELYGCNSKPNVGISSGLIKNSAITANSNKPGKEPWRGRLNNLECWCAADVTNVELVIDLVFTHRLQSFATQGNPDKQTSEWVTSMSVMYKERVVDDWRFYGASGVITVFTANTDREGIVDNNFEPGIDASIIKFTGFSFFNAICMRVELYGDRVTMKPIGIQDSSIPDEWFMSSFSNPHRSRLNGPDIFEFNLVSLPSRFLQVKLGTDKIITGIATKGGLDAYVNKFSMLYSKEQVFWSDYHEKGVTKMFSGSNDGTIKLHAIRKPFTAAYLRIQFNSVIKIGTTVPFNFEIYGQNASSNALGMENGEISNEQIKELGSVSSLGTFVSDARLKRDSIWCANNESSSSIGFLMIDLLIPTVLTAVGSQGHPNESYWITNFAVTTTTDFIKWEKGIEFTFMPLGHNAIMKNYFHEPVVARWVEIELKRFYGYPCVRFELYGSRGDVEKNVALFKLTEQSSSGTHDSSKAVDGNLTATIGAASCATTQEEDNPWWRVDLEHEYLIKSVNIKNNEDACCFRRLSKLTIKTSVDLITNFTCATNIKFTAAGEHRKIACQQMLKGRYVEIINYLRTVLTLCEVEVEAYVSAELKKDPLGLESGLVKNESMTASSSLGDNYLPHHGRFNTIIGSGGWCALNNNPNTEYLQVDLEVRHSVKAVYTQGLASDFLPASAQVLTYSMSCSDNGINWVHVMQGGAMKILPKGKYILGTEILGRYFRFHPITWKTHICMRVEIIGERICSSPIVSTLPNYAIKESSFDRDAGYECKLSESGWKAVPDHRDQYLVINVVPGPKHVTRIVTTTHSKGNEAKRYSLSYSYNGIDWLDYMEHGKVKVFSGSLEKHLTVSHNLKRRLMAQLVKILVLGMTSDKLGLKVELYGCNVCDDQPLGMEDGSIQDSFITASSWKGGQEPYKGRFNGPTGWCANLQIAGEYMQVDLTRVMTISAITMQSVQKTLLGWPYSFTIAYSYDGRVFRNYTAQDGNLKTFSFGSPRRPQEKIYLERFVEARKIRVHVLKYYNKMCMKFELHGRKTDCFGPLELNFNDAKRLMKASSYLGLGFEPWYGDMRIGDESLTWCAAETSTQQFLQFDLIVSHIITEITVSGRTADPDTPQQLNDSWVSRYKLEYGDKMGDWKYYEYSGIIVEFQGNSGIKTAVSHAINTSLIARYVRILPVQWENWICMRVGLRGCKEKDRALGMENGDISEIHYDSVATKDDIDFTRLGSPTTSWKSMCKPLARPYLQIGLFINSKHITAIATAVTSDERTWSYYLSYTEDGHIWTDFTQNGVLKIFKGNRNKYLVVKHNLGRTLLARGIRFNPITWQSKPSFKVELYGNEVCNKSLGFESGLLPNSSFTAGSFSPGFEPWNARLNSPRPWCYKDANNLGLLYIDLLNLTDVTGIASQKISNSSLGFTLKIKIFYSLDNVHWKCYGWVDNDPKDIPIIDDPFIDGIKMISLRTFTARYLAIQTCSFTTHPCLRIEVYGCQAKSHCPKPLGMTSGKIANESLSASSYLSPDFFPWFARLDTKIAGGGWCAARNNISEFLQVDLKDQYNLTKIILQGRGVEDVRDSAWVSKFSLEYSMDGIKWKKHTENGTQEFEGNTNSGKREVVFTKLIMARFARIFAVEWHNWTCLRFEFEGCNGRTVPFGFETGEYRSDNFMSSNSYADNRARLNQYPGLFLENDQAYSSTYNYLQIRIEPYGRVVTAIAIQGYDKKWVSTYLISRSNDGKHFTYYMEKGHPMIFEGSKDTHDVRRQQFSPEVRARFLRFLPRTINYGYTLRMELYGYEVCSNPLGMQDGRIPNVSITASSFKPGHETWRVRPGTSGFWSPKTSDGSWLQVDVGKIVRLTAIAMTFDANARQGVKVIKLASKKFLANEWLVYGQRGNEFRKFPCFHCVVLTKIPIDGDSIIARYFKVIVVYYNYYAHMKLELYGCEQVCMEELGMEASFIKDVSITASSALNQRSLPSNARLNTNLGYGAWCANHMDTSPHLQVDLRWLHEVRAISTQGQHYLYGDAWVQQYTVSYLKGLTNETWENYMESGVIKVFVANNDSLGIVQNVLTSPITARLLRIHPISWSSKACLRLKVYGCEVSREDNIVPLGMTSMDIPDQNIIASSHDNSYEPWKARFQNDGWMAPQLPNQFLQIDLGITGAEILAIGARHSYNKHHRVLEFFLSFSDEGSFWYQCMEYSKPKRFHSEIHQDSSAVPAVQKHFLPQPIRTRYMKFEVARWKLSRNFDISLELYGNKDSGSSLLKPVAYSASSYIHSNPPRLADVNSGSAWCAEFTDERQFLQLDLGKVFHVTGVETASLSVSETVNNFTVSTSLYGSVWVDYAEKQIVRVFNVTLRELFGKIVSARFVRLKPKTWTKSLCMRVGIIGKAPTAPLGISKWRIANFQMNATSHAGPGTEPWRARLNSEDLSDAWCAGEDVIGQYLHIDLLHEHHVTYVSLQGRFATGSEAWVIDYWLLYSMDNIVWNYYMNGSYAKILKGNVDPFGVVKVATDPYIRCRFIRIKPKTWHGHMCLKTELYGYQILELIGVNNGEVPDSYILASTFKPNREPWKARLNRNDDINSLGWEPLANDSTPYLEIKVANQMRLMGVSTQGKHSITSPAFVTNYTLKTSLDGINWIDYVEDGTQKIFNGNSDTFSVVTNILKSEIAAKALRILPVNWTNGIALRVELLGLSVPPTDGQYTPYSNWSSCSVTCGQGFQYRTRNCSNPEPSFGGKNCTRFGSNNQTRRCDAPLCPAPIYTAPPLFKKDEPTTLIIQNCRGLSLTIDLGDSTKLHTSSCSIEHTYNVSGIVEIMISAPNHEITRNAHYVEHAIQSFQDYDTIKAILLGHNFTSNWRINGGVILQLGYSYGDGYSQNSTLVTRDGFQTGVALHKYNSVGVFPIELVVSNLLSTLVINLEVIVEIAVNVSLTFSTETIFDRIYEYDDVIFEIEVLNGSNPHFVINVDDGTPLANQTSTTLVHKYRSAALRSPNVLAYNNVSSYHANACNITIHKMNLIVNATLDVHDTIYPNSTFVNLTVPHGNPFLCLINLGDGTLINRTSLDNSTMFNHTYIVGTYTIAINCSNHLSYQLLSKTMKVQRVIQNVILAPTTPIVVNDTHTFVVTADNKGTNSCYVVSPGDGSMYGIGKSHCLIDHPSVTFIDMQQPFLISHTYQAIGQYMVTVSGSNAISSVNLADRAVVVQGRCSYPNTSFLSINTIKKQDPTRITRVQTLVVYTKIYIDCDPTSLYDVDWNITLASMKDSKGLSYKTIESLSIYKRTLDYGLYQVLFNVSMRGLVGVYEVKYGFIEVNANDLVPIILGGHFVRRGQNISIYIDASETYDPDFTTGEYAFEFYWSCSNGTLPSIESIKSMSPLNRTGLPVFSDSGFCQSYRNFYKGGSKMNYTNEFMSIGDNYSVAVDVFKDVKGMIRHARFVQVMSIVDAPSLYLRCLRNCLTLVNPNDKLSLEVFSPDLTDTAFYHWRLFREVKSNGSISTWMEIEGLRNLTNTKLNSRFVVIAPNAIATKERYKLQVTGWMSGEPSGLAEYLFSFNMPPYGGSCDVDIHKDSADDSLFAFKCSNWTDNHLPLTYQLYYRTSFGLDLLFYHSVLPSFVIPLPLGEAIHNFTLNMTMRIVDSLGVFNTTLLQTMVKRNESSNMTALLLNYLNFVDGTSSELQGLLDKGKLSDACIKIIAMMSVLNSMEGELDHLSLRIQIRNKVAEILSQWDSKSLLEVQLLATALSENIALLEEVSVVTQRHCLDSFSDMSDFTIDQSRDRSVSETTLTETMRIIFYGLSKTLSASSDSAKVPYMPGLKDINVTLPNSNLTLSGRSLPSDVRLEAEQICKDAFAKIDDLAKELLKRLVTGEEPFKIDVPVLTMSLQRINQDDIDNKFFTIGNAAVRFPSSNTLFGPSHGMNQLSVKLITIKRNVFTWDITWLRIKTELLLVELKDPVQESLFVSQLSQPIHLIIPRVISTFPPPETSFIKKEKNSLIFHQFNITSLKPMNFRIQPVEGQVSFGIYWKYAVRPEKSSEYFVGRLPDFSSCKSKDSSYTDCEKDPHTIFIDTNQLDRLGEYFLGIETLEDYNANEKERVRRSACEGLGRSKRSCLEYKTPPPTPPPNMGGPIQYNSRFHFNYTIQRFYSPCLFWDAQNSTWRGQGCKTGNLSTYQHVHCKCTHLTSFGGDVLVAPNPIDFDKVFAGFANISDNMAVLGAIIAAFSIYTILAVWLRRLDKRDAARGGITVIKSTIDSTEDHPYEVIVQTGSWSNSGTSSNVFLTIIGEEGESAAIHLTDKCKLLFDRGTTDEFIVLLPKDIGKIHFVRVWHDMTGPSSSWYLNYIIVRNTKTGAQFNFVSDQWFALEKEDGAIDRILKVSAKEEMTTFKTLFRQKTEKDICDGHLWISVMAKPPKSTFTRVQRLSCCMSLLFTAMITNAMFYNVGNEPDTSSVTLGPITISIKQIIIGIQSSFIALPINIIILQIFKNARAKENTNENEFGTRYLAGQDEGDKEDDKSSKAKKKGLPHWTVYIAWTLCVLATVVSAAFTLFYSMMWGKETSNKWISSMLVSFFQDALVTQPLKIFLLALFISTFLKKIPQEFAKKDAKEQDLDSLQVHEPGNETSSEDIISLASRCQPPNEDLVRRARDYKMKELRMHGIIKENIFFVVFLLALLGVGYSIRDYESFRLTSNIKGMFTYKVKDNVTFWTFVEKTVLQFSFSRKWYNAGVDRAEGFTNEKNYYMVGMPRLRQVRVKKENCTLEIARNIKPHCVGEYSILNEDTSYYLPGWKEPGNLTSDACPIPWRYQTSWELDGIPFWGHKAVYNGGGFTADLGYEMWQAADVVSTLKKHNWLDEFSRAVMVEFTIFDPQVNLFSMVTYAVEITGTGSGASFVKVDTFKLYLHLGPSKMLLILCEVLSILICLILTFYIFKRVKNEGLKYFKNKWNLLESAQLGLCYAAVVLFIVRLTFTAKAIQKLQENPFLFVSFQYIAKWHEVNVYVIGIIVFIATMKFLRLLKFNRHIAILSRTISNCLKDVAIIGFQALLVFTAFSIVAYVTFGTTLEDFSTYILTLQSQLTMMLGKGYFSEMSRADPVLGPLYFTFFVFAMMFFLLNMFVAVIADTYADESTEVDPDSEEFVMAGFMMDRLRSLFSREKPTTEPWMEIKSPEYKDWPGTKQEMLFEKARQSHEMLKKKEIQLDYVMQGLAHAEKNIAKSEHSIAGKTMAVFPSHNEFSKKYDKVALILLTEGYDDDDEEEC